jgi:hypothetical protein
MRLLSWFRKPAAPRRRPYRNLTVEQLEARTVPSASFGLAFSMGGPIGETGKGIATDPTGNIYVAGFFSGTADLDPGPGQALLTAQGTRLNTFLAKYSPNGGLLWATRLDGAVQDLGLDANGNAYVTGGTTYFSDEGPSHVFLDKLDPSGNVLWSQQLPRNPPAGSAGDTAYALAVDGSGNVYTTGSLYGAGIFIAKNDTNGNLTWLKTMSGTASGGGGTGQGLTLDGSGNIYATGYFVGSIDFDPGPGTNVLTSTTPRRSSPSQDVFVLKLDNQGNFRWAGSMGGQGADVGNDIAVDGSGSVYVTGRFSPDSHNDFDPGKGTSTLPNAGNTDVFLVKLDANRNFVWARSWGGAYWDTGSAIALDSAGNVYVAGDYAGTVDFDPSAGKYLLSGTDGSGHATDGTFVSELTGSGNFVWAWNVVSMSATGQSSGLGDLFLDGAGNIYTTGAFQGTGDFDPGPGAATLTSTPNSDGTPSQDVFVSKLTSSSVQAATTTSTASSTGGSEIVESPLLDGHKHLWT